MKRIIVILMSALLLFMLSGCSLTGDNINLTDEENDMVAQYIAGCMIKHTNANEWKYYKVAAGLGSKNTVSSTASNTNQNPSGNSLQSSATGTDAYKSNGNAESGSVSVQSLTEMLDINGCSISCTKASAGARYPDEEYVVSVPASNGCKAVGIEFEIKNTTSSAIILNTSGKNLVFTATAGENTINQYATLLKNDFSNLKNVSIPSGGTYTACVVFQINDTITDSNIAIKAFCNGKQSGETYSVKL